MLLRRTNRFLDYCESLPGQGLRVEVVQVLQVVMELDRPSILCS
jgi:hypothetical protein